MTWHEVSLKQICAVDWGNTKLTKSSYVVNGRFLAVSAAGADGLIDHYEHEADVPVLSAIGAQCGRMFYPGERFTAIKNTITLTPKEDMSDGKFLYYLFTHVELPQRGAGQPFISKGDIEAFRVSIPESLEEQRKIVEKLDSAFAEIDLLERNLGVGEEKANQLIQSILSSAFSSDEDESELSNKSGEKTNATKLVPLSEVFTLEYGKPLDKEFRKGDGAYQAYGANGPISPASKYLIEGPCIIVGRKGSAGEITFVENNAWPLDVTYYIKHNPEESDLRYLFYTLKSLNIKQFVRGVKPGLNRNDVYELNIPFPPLEKQQEIVEKLVSAFTEVDLLKAKIKVEKDYATALRQSLLSSAFAQEEEVA